MTMVRVKDVSFRYTDAWVLQDISFELPAGEFMSIIGPNGSGKTTLIKIVDGILAPQAGTVDIASGNIARLNRRAIAQAIAVVPQDMTMVFPFTVEEVVAMGRTPHLARLAFEGERDHEIVEKSMEMTDILQFRDRSMHELSGGERQRVLIARALAQEPAIMLLDESTAFLDIRHQIVFFDLVKTLNRERGVTVISVTHDINLAALYGDRIMLISKGRVHSMGTAKEVITEEAIKNVYHTNVLVDVNPSNGLPRVTVLSDHSAGEGSRWKTGAAPQL